MHGNVQIRASLQLVIKIDLAPLIGVRYGINALRTNKHIGSFSAWKLLGPLNLSFLASFDFVMKHFAHTF